MITMEHYRRSSEAILGAADPADHVGVTICLDAGAKALLAGGHEIAGAMLDEAACRAGIIDSRNLGELHRKRLEGTRTAP